MRLFTTVMKEAGEAARSMEGVPTFMLAEADMMERYFPILDIVSSQLAYKLQYAFGSKELEPCIN
jgi:hypothetical protein